MKKLTICTVSCLMIALTSCTPTEETVTAVENGPFKIVIRSQEFHHSGVRNIDVCVAQASAREFPTSKSQCFLHGFDFSGLYVTWRGEREVEVSFKCGRVAYFKNDVLVYPEGPVPEEFHATLREDCGYTGSTTCQGS